MPIYQYLCFEDNFSVEEMRKMGDFTAPQCPRCGKLMTKIITPATVVLKGAGWSRGDQQLLKKRSEDQGKKFFHRHPDKQTLVSETLNRKE
jgi:putative FmdB family regulatory protein